MQNPRYRQPATPDLASKEGYHKRPVEILTLVKTVLLHFLGGLSTTFSMASIKGKPSFAAVAGQNQEPGRGALMKERSIPGWFRMRIPALANHFRTCLHSSSLKRPVFFSCATCFPHPDLPNEKGFAP